MLEEIAVDDGRRREMAAQAIEHAHHQFSRERYARDYIELYRRLLA